MLQCAADEDVVVVVVVVVVAAVLYLGRARGVWKSWETGMEWGWRRCVDGRWPPVTMTTTEKDSHSHAALSSR